VKKSQNTARFPLIHWRFLVVLAIAFIPALVVVSTVALDRLGYCVNEIWPGELGLNADPYIQNVTMEEASIVWRTRIDLTGTVRYGLAADDFDRTVEVPEGRIHVAQLTGLSPDTTYAYEVSWGSQVAEGSFTTAPDINATVTFAAIGDSGKGNAAQYAVAQQLIDAAPDVVLHTGDVVYRRGAICHYNQRFFDPYADLIATTPVYPAVGNHDLLSNEGKPYFETFVLPANNPEGSEDYYSFVYGPVHVIVLNSEFYAADDDESIATQREWLAQELEGSTRPWQLVTLHRPLYSSTSGKADERIRDDLGPLFYEGQVDLVLSGHAHNYERFEPIDGVTYVVTGGGGADLYDLDPGSATAASAKRHHLVRLTIAPETLTLEAIDDLGDLFDEFQLSQ
jgi:acid phosphatase type 7